MKTGYVDGRAKVMPRAKLIRFGMAENFVQIRLPHREIRITGQRQMHPFGRFDERRISMPGGVQCHVARAGGVGSRGQFRGIQTALPCHSFAMRSRKARDVSRDPQP